MTQIIHRSRRTRTISAFLTVCLATMTAGCGDDDPTADTVTLVTYSSFPVADTMVNAALDAFGAREGVTVEILVAGDTGTMLTKAALTAGNPEGDVMWGVDNNLLSRAVEAGVFSPHVAAERDRIDPSLTALIVDDLVTPVDFGDVCVNYDAGWYDERDLEPPATLDALIDPAYANQLVVQNPASSSPGLAFMLATIDRYGDGWESYWADLVANGVSVTDDWDGAYYGAFTRAGGDRPLVVSYGSSPPYEVLFGDDPDSDTAPTGVIADTCYRQVEFAGVLAGTDVPELAGRLVDYLLSVDFQRHVADDLYVFPVHPDVELDPIFQRFAVIPDDPASVDPALIEQNRAEWVDTWTQVVGA